MIEIKEAKVEDIYAAVADALDVFSCEGDLIEGTMNSFQRGKLFSVWCEGELLGVIGGVFIWAGVATVGTVLTKKIYRHRITLMRTMNRFIGDLMRDYGIHRMEMAVKKDYPIGHRWAKALGFEAEGTLRKYSTDKSDFVLYGRVE